jgi:hypothetical protein
LPPRGLAPPLHRLPPILDNVSQTPTSSCSKGARGLSVQPRVLGIFTETTVSPDPSLRQRPSRYAIRAGRNFACFLRFRRRRLSLHPGRVHQGPASDPVRRFSSRLENRISRPGGRSVVTGSSTECADFPRDYPLAPTTSLGVAHEEGFPVISRCISWDHSQPGQFDYPTRNFATLGPFIVVTPSSMTWLEVAGSFLAGSHGRP